MNMGKRTGFVLQYASEELRGDLDMVLAAVKSNGYALTHASEELKNNKDVALEAVRKDGQALEYASEELRGDRDMIAWVYQNFGPSRREDFLFSCSKIYKSDQLILIQTVLAAECVSAPVISIEVEEDRDNFNITFTQLSGTQGKCTVDKECTVGDAAAAILPVLNRQKKEKGEDPYEYIHLVLGDKKFVPWDHDKPLADFLT